jgi:hypothetical protein
MVVRAVKMIWKHSVQFIGCKFSFPTLVLIFGALLHTLNSVIIISDVEEIQMQVTGSSEEIYQEYMHEHYFQCKLSGTEKA